MTSGSKDLTDCEDGLLKRLTLEEKLSLLSGASLWTLAALPRFDIPSIFVSDGPHGVRKPIKELSLQESHPATCFPTACALACSWDESLAIDVGRALGREALHYNISVLLGPGLNLKRHPAGGRNFEYFAEDPVLSGRMAAAMLLGIQEYVGACAKHACVNNQESHRFVVNAIVDPRTLRELYYRGFEIAIKKAQPATIMCAYNRINGVYCSESYQLNTQILRDEWGFQGSIMTDWGATNDRVEGIKAGMDLEMPGSHGAHNHAIHKALRDGDLKEQEIDLCAQRMLNLIQRYKGALNSQVKINWEEHDQLARQAARDCIVLLKNDGILPLAKGSSVSVIGDFAKNSPRFQGMGSSQVCSYKVTIAVDEIGKHTNRVHFAPGYLSDDDADEVTQHLLDEAVEIAKQGDVVLLFVGLPEIMESEGFDRSHICLPAQHNALIEQIYGANHNVVVILSNGGIVQLPPICSRVPAILEGYLLGQASGGAIVDILFGVQSPSGKLAETMPYRLEDVLADSYFPGTRDEVEHREGLNVGYRYFDSANAPVRYPFGHGLSYTTFEYSNLQLLVVCDELDRKQVEVSFELKNVGSMMGKEVAQVYVRDVLATVYRPVHELRDFAKVSLSPGESKSVRLMLHMDAFAIYDIGAGAWVVEPGEFEIQVGSSSRDIRLQGQIDFKAGNFASDVARDSYPPVNVGTLPAVDDVSFTRRFASESFNVLSRHDDKKLFHRNSLLKEVASCHSVGKLLMHIVYKEASKEIKPGPSRKRQQRMVRANVENLPLRTLVLFSKGSLSFYTLDLLISVVNNHFGTALKLLTVASLYAICDTIKSLLGIS